MWKQKAGAWTHPLQNTMDVATARRLIQPIWPCQRRSIGKRRDGGRATQFFSTPNGHVSSAMRFRIDPIIQQIERYNRVALLQLVDVGHHLYER